MVKFRFADQDFFEVDPVRYAGALGEDGLAAYRQAVAQYAQYTGADLFALRYARERLAILDGDVEAIVSELGGDLSTLYQFIRVAEAMAELGLDDEVLAWCTRGIAQTSGWQVSQLYDLACGVHARREQPLEVLALRRAQHERMPSSSTYRALRAAAEARGAWPVERVAARATLPAERLMLVPKAAPFVPPRGHSGDCVLTQSRVSAAAGVRAFGFANSGAKGFARHSVAKAPQRGRHRGRTRRALAR